MFIEGLEGCFVFCVIVLVDIDFFVLFRGKVFGGLVVFFCEVGVFLFLMWVGNVFVVLFGVIGVWCVFMGGIFGVFLIVGVGGFIFVGVLINGKYSWVFIVGFKMVF